MKVHEQYPAELKDFVLCAKDAFGATPRAYSGRGMYGKQCLALYIDNDEYSVSLWDVALLAADWNMDFAQALGAPRIDTLGRNGEVLYWPGIPADGLVDEEEGEEDGE